MQSSIQVGVNGDAVWVKVEGKGSFLNSGNLKEFTREMVNRGYREFVVDLEDCAMMDSTFMGTMAGVALRLKELGQGHLHVVRCGQRSRDLLCGLGLDQIFDIHANGSAAPECQQLKEKSPNESSAQKKQENALVKIVRDATERFQNVAAAEAEGYGLLFGCVSGGDFGAMGLHYVNTDLAFDGELDAAHPEIVLYEPTSNGRLRLTGADYLVIADAWNAKHAGPPELNGQLFHLFESPNRFGLPAFYTLHVWAWKENPNGTFTNWNPNVSCDAFSQ